MSTAFIICTRMNSRRIPNKCSVEINGKALLHHLHDRLMDTGIKVVYAIPESERKLFLPLFEKLGGSISYVTGFDDDPLKRMDHAAKRFNISNVIRVCHDKIFINKDHVYSLLDQYHRMNLDYIYSSEFIPGTAFEIINYKVLEDAARCFEKVEHVSYAIKAVTQNTMDYPLGIEPIDARFLVDFPEDIEFLNSLFGILGNKCTDEEIFRLLKRHPDLSKINRMPLVTIYTCGYNAGQWLEECLRSVENQSVFDQCEYLLIDDCSKDSTPLQMSLFSAKHPNVKYFRNPQNIGLASSSNVALKNARGSFIVRMDADDHFIGSTAVGELYSYIRMRDLDAIYPNNYFGEVGKVQKGNVSHHIGGTMFKTRAINHVKFTEGLRNYEGLDVWSRAKDCLNIGYLNKPMFFYRQHPGSLSKNNLDEREKTKRDILDGTSELRSN